MKEYKQVLVLTAVALIFYMLGSIVEQEEIIGDIKSKGKYTIDADTELIGVLKPIKGYNEGDLQYIRPNGKKAIQV